MSRKKTVIPERMTAVDKKKIFFLKKSSDLKLTTQQKEWRSYIGLILGVVACIDTIVTASSLPVITLHASAVPLSIFSLALSQAFFFFPQLWSTIIAENFAKKFGGMKGYSIMLFATSVSTLCTATALREGSINMYLSARLVNGFFRHSGTLGNLALEEIPNISKRYDIKKVILFSIIGAMLVGGIAGDYGPEIARTMDILAAIEFVIAIIITILSFTLLGKTKTIPAIKSVNAYKKWLLRQKYSNIRVFFPIILNSLCASISQCMYPFVDRRVFNLSYTLIGIHMAILIFIQNIFAPFILKICGEKNILLFHICTTFITLGAWIGPWVAENGIIFYLIVTLLFTDLSAALLESILGTIVLNNFTVKDKPFAQKFLQHVKQTIKQWSVILLIGIQILYKEQKDSSRLMTVPAAIGLIGFALTRQVILSSILFMVIFCLLTTLSPINDEEIWGNIITLFRSK